MRRPALSAALAALTAAGALAACELDAGDFGPPNDCEVRVVPATATLPVGDTLRLEGEAVDCGLAGGAIRTWLSEDPGVAEVDVNGLVSARQPGETTVGLNFLGENYVVRGDARITVVAR